MKNNNIKKLIPILLLIIALIISIINITANKQNEIIQLIPQGERQMMGYIIKTTNDKLIVIDGGTIDDTQQLVDKINENGGKVDIWFLTHAHDDHVGAFTEIVNKTDIQIDKIYKSFNEYSWYEENDPTRKEFIKILLDTLQNEKIKSNIEEVELNQIIELDNVKAEILGVKNPEITENAGNEQSMVIKFNFEEKTFLILGDTGINSSKKLIENQKDKLKSDIVQMSHHGQNGATEELYNIIDPRICFWPTPAWLWNNDSGTGENSGNWKTFETRSWIEKMNVEKNYIAKDGIINIKVK